MERFDQGKNHWMLNLKEWEEDGVAQSASLSNWNFKGKGNIWSVWVSKDEKNSGLVQIHGGGQYADYRAPVSNAKRGYATISIS